MQSDCDFLIQKPVNDQVLVKRSLSYWTMAELNFRAPSLIRPP